MQPHPSPSSAGQGSVKSSPLFTFPGCGSPFTRGVAHPTSPRSPSWHGVRKRYRCPGNGFWVTYSRNWTSSTSPSLFKSIPVTTRAMVFLFEVLPLAISLVYLMNARTAALVPR